MTRVIKQIPISETEFQYLFQCPGCNQEHAFNDKIWTFNNDYEQPTLSPSFLIRGSRWKDGDRNKGPESFVCHSFIKDGKIQYLDDCTHELKGLTVDLIDYK